MFEWLQDHMWETWLGLAIVLGVAELFSLDLVLLMLAAGALVGVVAALLDAHVAVQVLAAVAASAGMMVLVRPSVVKRLHSGPQLTLGHAALVGKQGVVVEEVSGQAGQIKIAGEIWTARPYDETDVIEPGATVDVFEIRGATALVHRVQALDS
jgi:membrane protein implicated in regulation of membrane protease activity